MRLLRSVQIALFLLVVASGIGPTVAATPSIGDVIAVKGTVYRDHEGKHDLLVVGAALFVTDVITAEGDGKAKLLLRSGSVISVGEKAKIRLADFPSSDNQFTTRVNAEQGAIRLFIAKSQAGGHFEVDTETAVAAVRGTDWIVDVMPDQTSVAVLSGSVAVRSKAPGGGEVLLDKPGDGTDVKRGAPPTAPKTWGAQRLRTTVERASFE